jgi:GNAT superfamily N-acetyltransferase
MIIVRDLEVRDRAAWQALYTGYGEFYEAPLSQENADRVWGWLLDPQHESFALVAVDDDDRPIGLAHYREFARPLAGRTGIHLDDLFTAPDARGSGAASALIARLKDLATERGCDVVRWITANDNATAQRLYDRLATRTEWVTYDLKLD